MADVYSLVGQNAQKTSPSTKFGTRELVVLKVEQAGVFVNFANANSLYSKSVRAVQQRAEIYGVFAPVDASTDYYHVIVAADTVSAADDYDDETAGYGLLEASIEAGSGVAATVTAVTL